LSTRDRRVVAFRECALQARPVVPIVTCTIDGARYGVVNGNTFDNVDRTELSEAATDFEGETTQARLARRRRNRMPEAAHGAGAARGRRRPTGHALCACLSLRRRVSG
jgi:hypothetical protein